MPILTIEQLFLIVYVSFMPPVETGCDIYGATYDETFKSTSLDGPVCWPI